VAHRFSRHAVELQVLGPPLNERRWPIYKRGQMMQVLTDAKDSIDRFLLEAKMCAQKEYGFASMLTTFSVILGVSEAASEQTRNDDLFQWFVSQMDDRDSWLVVPDSETFTESGVGKKLAQIRNSLSHQFSLPSDVMLVNSIAEARIASGQKPDRYYISTQEFVGAVKSAVHRIVECYPKATFDSDQKGIDRRMANRVVASTGAPHSPGSSPVSDSSIEDVISSASVSSSSSRVSRKKKSENGTA